MSEVETRIILYLLSAFHDQRCKRNCVAVIYLGQNIMIDVTSSMHLILCNN